jgi:hypothetical protein
MTEDENDEDDLRMKAMTMIFRAQWNAPLFRQLHVIRPSALHGSLHNASLDQFSNTMLDSWLL